MDDTTTFEPHYSVNQLAEQWCMSRETVRKLVKG
jgi:DNA-binding GntR family transcriptional regulator